MRSRLSVCLTILAALGGLLAVSHAAPPYDGEQAFTPVNPIDDHVLALLRKRGIEPARRCTDEIFVRRLYFDLIGTMPTAAEVREFVQDTRPNKRALLIDTLLQRPEFNDYWSMKWGDLLRIKAEFPINLWPNAVQAYHRWVHTAIRDNMLYDQFVRALLTSSGSNFRVPPVNFYRASQSREPAGLAAITALTFMGTRLETWPAPKRAEMATFFSRILFKKTDEWKEEIVCNNPAPGEALTATFPDGKKVTIPAGADPRLVFADWLISADNYWFGRNIVNRMWSWFMGRGIVHEPDDIRRENPPVNPELLAYLEQQLVAGKYDLKTIYRLILNSATYQQSCVPASNSPDVEMVFAVYPVRRLEAEVIIDALTYLAGDGQGYSSAVPEPFTWIPESHRAITVADGSITSAFLEMFGRSPRDTGTEAERNNQPSEAQALSLLNSSDVQKKIENSRLLAKLVELSQGNKPELIASTYVTILSRQPTAQELPVAEKYFSTPGLSLRQAHHDLAWALINSKEFLYRH